MLKNAFSLLTIKPTSLKLNSAIYLANPVRLSLKFPV